MNMECKDTVTHIDFEGSSKKEIDFCTYVT